VAAVALLSPLLVRAAGALLASPAVGRVGAAGRLAARLFAGEPARNGIAVTALAMALGMTLAMLVTVASMRATVKSWVETSIGADLFVQPRTGSGMAPVGDMPGEVLAFVSGIDGVEVVDPIASRDVTDRRGRPFSVFAGDFTVFSRFGSSPLLGGGDANAEALGARARGEVFVSEPYARRFGADAGDEVEVPTPQGLRRFRVAGVFRDFSNDRGTVVMDRELWLRLYEDDRLDTIAVLVRPGVDPRELRRRLLAAAEGRFALMVTTNTELRREVLVIFDRTFRVTRALEAIAVTVAILGIANALLASAVERRRTFGLLRAIGADASQIAGATRLEALFIGAVGAATALPAGAAFAAILLGVINPQSFGWTVSLAVPVLAIAAVTLLVLAASAAAGVYPGSLAARTDPAAALAEE
jgi:putative ABC transport system permease protein